MSAGRPPGDTASGTGTDTGRPAGAGPGGQGAAGGDGIAAALAEAGFDAEMIPALLGFDVAQFQWYRMAMKGEMLRGILRRLGTGIELVQFQALTAIQRIETGVGRTAEPATVGLLADELGVDPSRASRLTADLVARGLIARAAAQQDGRRVVLVLTGAGTGLLEAVRAGKWAVLAEVFRGWEAAEVTRFAEAVRRYSSGVQNALQTLAQPGSAAPLPACGRGGPDRGTQAAEDGAPGGDAPGAGV